MGPILLKLSRKLTWCPRKLCYFLPDFNKQKLAIHDTVQPIIWVPLKNEL